MARPNEYCQCTLRKTRSSSASVVRVSFIPARFARQQRAVRLRRPDGSWDDGWVVEYVGASLSEEELPDAHSGIKSHRRATGDALPRGRF